MAPETKFKNDVKVTGKMTAKGGFEGKLTGGAFGTTGLNKASDYALTDGEKLLYIGIAMTAANKTLTLGLEAKQIAFIRNEGGTNSFTVKNVAGDTGTALAAGKTVLVVGSNTANASKVIALD